MGNLCTNIMASGKFPYNNLRYRSSEKTALGGCPHILAPTLGLKVHNTNLIPALGPEVSDIDPTYIGLCGA